MQECIMSVKVKKKTIEEKKDRERKTERCGVNRESRRVLGLAVIS